MGAVEGEELGFLFVIYEQGCGVRGKQEHR